MHLFSDLMENGSYMEITREARGRAGWRVKMSNLLVTAED